MSAPIIAFFNNKGGVGKTSLAYHLAWMYWDLGAKVIAVDLDPQANLTAAFLDEAGLEDLQSDSSHTIVGAVEPLLKGTGDIREPKVLDIQEGLYLLAGDLKLSALEDELAEQWPHCLAGRERAFRVISAFWRVVRPSVRTAEADIVLVDLGPNLGAINRAGLIASDHVVVPLAPDLFSLQGLRNLGPQFRKWRIDWKLRLSNRPLDLELPEGSMSPLGYVVLQHSVRLDRPVKAYDKWMARIPGEYRIFVLDEPHDGTTMSADPHNLALLKNYRSLVPMAQEARKPIFMLKSGDGAIGSHFQAVLEAKEAFRKLALRIAERAGVTLPQRPS